jgi:hypothetical protein
MAEYWERMSGPASEAPPAKSGQEEAPADQVSELWRLLGVTAEKPVAAPEPATSDLASDVSAPGSSAVASADTTAASSGGWKVEPLPTLAEGGIAALFAQALDFADEPSMAPPPPDPAAVSTLVPETLRGADTLESLLADPPSVAGRSVWPVEPDRGPATGPPSLDSFAAPAVPLLGSQPPAWGPDAGVVPAQSGRARLAEMLDHLPDEPTARVTPDDIHVERPVVAPAAIWFWGDDDIYAGRLSSAARPQSNVARRRRKVADLRIGAPPSVVAEPKAKGGRPRRLRLR